MSMIRPSMLIFSFSADRESMPCQQINEYCCDRYCKQYSMQPTPPTFEDTAVLFIFSITAPRVYSNIQGDEIQCF